MHWFSDPRGVVQRFNDGPDMVLEQRDAQGAAPQWVRYVQGQGTDQPLAMEIYSAGAPPTPGTGAQYYYHADGEGSIRLLTDAQAQVANRYDYDSYGRRLAVTESVAQPYGWKGREWLPGAELLYNRARFYDPAMGRFISEDPLWYDGGQTNFFNFAANNPKNWNDPTGYSAASETGIVTAGVAGSLIAGEVAGTGATAVETAEVVATSGSALQKVGAEIACKFFEIADVFALLTDPQLGKIVKIESEICGAVELHHAVPKYLGGALTGLLVPLEKGYHLLISLEFRRRWPYGSPKPGIEALKDILKRVYEKYPIPPIKW